YDLRSARTVAVNDHYKRERFRSGILRFITAVVGKSLPHFNSEKLLSARKEHIADLDGRRNKTAWIVAQIEDQLSHSLLFQLIDRFTHLVAGCSRKLSAQPDVANSRP